MNRVVVFSILAALAASTTGCASAHYVSKQSDSGVVAIPSNNDYWPFHYRQEAEALIRQHVGPDYEIVEERQVVTGMRTTNNEQTQRDLIMNKKQTNVVGERESTTGTVTSSDVTEWQITYRRRYSPTIGDTRNHGTTSGLVPSVLPAGGTTPMQPAANTATPRQP